MRNLRQGLLFSGIGALVLGGVVAATAQEFGGQGRWRVQVHSPSEAPTPGFMFCRVAYQRVRRERNGQGWRTDYPDSDRNFMLRLSQLTTTDISQWAHEVPFHAVVQLTDPEIFQCPFLFMSDVGSAGLSREEVDGLRTYLLKGGFLWADDFWGDYAWAEWEALIGEVLNPLEYPIVEVPMDHEMLSTLYLVKELPQIPSIQFWRRSGRTSTSERGSESARPNLRAIFDHDGGRAMVVMTHNTDIADGWEREGEDDEFFYLFSPAAYGVGINIVLYALTH